MSSDWLTTLCFLPCRQYCFFYRTTHCNTKSSFFGSEVSMCCVPCHRKSIDFHSQSMMPCHTTNAMALTSKLQILPNLPLPTFCSNKVDTTGRASCNTDTILNTYWVERSKKESRQKKRAEWAFIAYTLVCTAGIQPGGARARLWK